MAGRSVGPGAAHVLVGRDRALEVLLGLVGLCAPPTVAFVHGPGGIGKSALLRELARRVEAEGRRVWRVEGRDRERAEERLRAVVQAWDDGQEGMLLVDTYEQAPTLGTVVRAALEAAPRPGVRVVVAGRRAPERSWSDVDGVSVRPVPLAPLTPADARELIALRGLVDVVAAQRVATWAGGSPLALTVATDALLAGQRLDLERLDADGVLATTLLRQLADDELEGHDRDVVAVAAIARAVDARLLAAVLPGVDGDHAEAWLRDLSFAEELGTRVTLHERVRSAARGALLAADPVREHELRRRIADHVYARAALGETGLSSDLTELIDDETVRWGMTPPHGTHYASELASGDPDRLAASLRVGACTWWTGTCRWLDEAREQVMVVRDAAGALAGFGIWVTPARAPGWSAQDTILGPWLADARRVAPDGDVILIRDSFDLSGAGNAHSPVFSVGSHAVLVRAGVANVRYSYVGAAPDDTGFREFARSVGYVRHPRLDVRDGEREVHCYINDMGPGGAMGATRDWVYQDLGLAPPPAVTPDALAADTVRAALRAFHRPGTLAESPLARGGDVESRAASVRRLLRDAIAGAFGDSDDERLQRAVIEHGYLSRDGGHDRAQHELHFGRAAYFRRLASASDRVSEYVLANLR